MKEQLNLLANIMKAVLKQLSSKTQNLADQFLTLITLNLKSNQLQQRILGFSNQVVGTYMPKLDTTHRVYRQ